MNQKHRNRWATRRHDRKPELVTKICRDVKAFREDRRRFPAQYVWGKLICSMRRLGVQNPGAWIDSGFPF